jgi:penicillin-binding protein 1A
VYIQGLKVYTTINKTKQEAAYNALRKGILDYDVKHGYRGPEGFVELPKANLESKESKRILDNALIDHPASDEMQSGVVLKASLQEVQVFVSSGETIRIKPDGLRIGREGLVNTAQPKIQIKPGSIIRVSQTSNGIWQITQMPEVQGALISLDPKSGAINAMVGGFDFKVSQFNHAIQAERQPGSSFKPFIYAAGVEKGIMPRTLVNDAYLSIGGSETGGKAWEPKNYDGKTDGVMTVRSALARSKNLVSVRIMRSVGTQYTQKYIQRFGFSPEKNPPYLTLALGAGSATPLQMSVGYSIFANGGYDVNPYLINKIVDAKGRVIFQAPPSSVGDESMRVLDAKTAFVMDSLMQEVTRSGTAATARAKLGRNDIAGKTGTTNDAHDAWFAGYHPNLSAVVWMGFDRPKSLGSNETGGGLSLPIWINYMAKALEGVPESPRSPPDGVVSIDGDWTVPEFTNRASYTSLMD